MSDNEHRAWMNRALQLAERGLYTTDPNPRVGCVLVKDGEVVGEGWHQRAGGAHAEIMAAKQAGDRAAGATCYVTLEPCSHHGRTPPCADALIAAGVGEVIAAMEDPNPEVSGAGIERLNDAGISARSGLLAAQARALNPGFVQRMTGGRPLVRLKLAMSLDGRTAMASGESQWITGADARGDVQRLRARSSAIVTGIGTVLADDPSMTVRADEVGDYPRRGEGVDADANTDTGSDARQPLRVIVDPHLSTPPDARILKHDGAVLIVTAADDPGQAGVLEAAGAEVVVLPGDLDTVNLVALMDELATREINEVLVETGAVLSGAMLRAGVIDELVVYMAPLLMGDAARGLFHLPGLDVMADRIELDIHDIRAVGKDWRIQASVRSKPK